MAVVHDRPGVTRDRIYADAQLDDRSFVVIDTGGLDLAPKDDLIANVKAQVDVAVKESDAIVLVVDVVLNSFTLQWNSPVIQLLNGWGT